MGNGGSINISEGGSMEESENQIGEDLNSTEISKGLINSSPLAFSPQIPVASLEKQEGVDSQSGTLWMNNSFSENQNYISQKGVPTMLTWTHGGIEVFVEGSWDNWTSKYLQKQFPDSLVISIDVGPSSCFRNVDHKTIILNANDLTWLGLELKSKQKL